MYHLDKNGLTPAAADAEERAAELIRWATCINKVKKVEIQE